MSEYGRYSDEDMAKMIAAAKAGKGEEYRVKHGINQRGCALHAT